jgi:Tol biopolymer transport system component
MRKFLALTLFSILAACRLEITPPIATVFFTSSPVSLQEQSATPTTYAPKRIVFPVEPMGDLYIVGADGTGLRAILMGDTNVWYGYPDWSPDGKRISFRCKGSICTSSPNGTDLHRLSNSGSEPIWSPDGSMIAYRRDLSSEPRGWELVITKADGSEQIVVAIDRSADEFILSWTQYSWSPDSQRIAFVAKAGIGRQIFIVKNDGSGLTQLTFPDRSKPFIDSAASPSWLPDGEHLVFARADGISIINADATDERSIVESYDVMSPEVSPNGRFIAFIHHGLDANRGMRIYDVESGQIIEVIPGQAILDFDWSPDSSRLAFVGGMASEDLWGLYIVDVLSSEITEATRFNPPSRIWISWEP